MRVLRCKPALEIVLYNPASIFGISFSRVDSMQSGAFLNLISRSVLVLEGWVIVDLKLMMIKLSVLTIS